jgi:hypothetical protein
MPPDATRPIDLTEIEVDGVDDVLRLLRLPAAEWHHDGHNDGLRLVTIPNTPEDECQQQEPGDYRQPKGQGPFEIAKSPSQEHIDP